MPTLTIQIGHPGAGVGTPRPYPFHVDAQTGDINRQDFWKGRPHRVIGFVADPDAFTVDVPWAEVPADPQRVVGMHVITEDADCTWNTWDAPVESVTETA